MVFYRVSIKENELWGKRIIRENACNNLAQER